MGPESPIALPGRASRLPGERFVVTARFRPSFARHPCHPARRPFAPRVRHPRHIRCLRRRHPIRHASWLRSPRRGHGGHRDDGSGNHPPHVRLLSSAGQEVQSSQSINRESTALLHDSSVMMSGLLLLCGAFCAMECWFVLMGEQGRDFAIRRLFGAHTSQIVGQFLRNEVPHILVSTLCGSALTLAAIIPSGQLRDVSFGHIPALLALPLLTFVLSSLLTCALEALCCGWACHTASPVSRPERTRRSHHASAR